jgi:chemotaxis protein MotB
VSYADFITLLFAFFVVMYASSSINEKKYDALSNSLVSAFAPIQVTEGESKLENKIKMSGEVAGTQTEQSPILIDPLGLIRLKREMAFQKREKMNRVEKDLTNALKPLIDEGKIGVMQTSKGVRVDIIDSYLFSPGSANITSPAALATLSQIAPILAKVDQAIDIEGHTDNQPINTKAFASNWELSAIRATTVLNILSQKGISEARLSATGFGSSRPIESNDTVAGKAKNRRVSILLLNDSGQQPGSDIAPTKTVQRAAPSQTQPNETKSQ